MFDNGILTALFKYKYNIIDEQNYSVNNTIKDQRAMTYFDEKITKSEYVIYFLVGNIVNINVLNKIKYFLQEKQKLKKCTHLARSPKLFRPLKI